MNQPKNQKLDFLLQELKQQYLEELPDILKKAKTYNSQQDWESLKEELHKLKGSGETYGWPDISELARSLEQLLEKEGFSQELLKKGLDIFGELQQAAINKNSLDLQQHPDFIKIQQFLEK